MAAACPTAPRQEAIFACAALDRVRIAYAVDGARAPLQVEACWLSHLQHDWVSPDVEGFVVVRSPS